MTKTFCIRLMKKAKLGRVVYGLVSPFVRRKKYVSDVAKQLEYLNGIEPDPHSSCITEKRNVGESLYDVDIVMPAYNAEKYLDEAVQSVVDQKTQYRFRLIVIDDGSKAKTPTILEKYANNDNVLVIHQENRGCSGARNSGLCQVQSDYIMFVDSDDILADNAVEALVISAKKTGADMVCGSWIIFGEGTQKRCSVKSDGIGYPWGKVFDSRLFSGKQFPLNYWYEDSIMSQIITHSAKKIAFIDDEVYRYRYNKGGVSANRSSNKTIDSLYITIQLYKDRKELGLVTDIDYYRYILKMTTLTCRRTIDMTEEIQQAVFAVMSDFVRSEFPQYLDPSKSDLELALSDNRFALYRLYSMCH